VKRAWEQRTETDYVCAQPGLNIFLTIITCGIFGLYLFYQLMRRMRDHNRRRIELLDAATTFAWEQATQQGIADELRPRFENVALQLNVMRTMIGDFRDPGIWTVIAFLASWIGYIIGFILLDGDLIKHSRAESAAQSELGAIYARLGHALPAEPVGVKGEHNYVGRILATVFTCGIYGLWWLYDVQRDGNEHFFENWPWEDGLAGSVQAMLPAGA
jgi:hypothetical protein